MDWKEVFTRAGLREISTALAKRCASENAQRVGDDSSRGFSGGRRRVSVGSRVRRRFVRVRIASASIPRIPRFRHASSSAEAHEIPALFSNNFIKCLLNNLSAPDNYLHECAVDCLARIVAFASDKKTESSKRLPSLQRCNVKDRLGSTTWTKRSGARFGQEFGQ